MPIFDYQCQSCNHRFSELRKISEKDEPVSCPKCNTDNAKRQLTSFAVGGMGSSNMPAQCDKAASCPSAAGGFG